MKSSSIAFGFAVSFVVYQALRALALLLGVIQPVRSIWLIPSPQPFGTASLVSLGCLVLTGVVSLLFGAFAASKASGRISARQAAAQSLVIVALCGMAVEASGANPLNIRYEQLVPRLRQLYARPIVEDSLSGLNLRVPHSEAVASLSDRFQVGNIGSASTYLSGAAGLPPGEAKERVDEIYAKYHGSVREIVRNVQARSVLHGLTWFLMTVGGVAGALLGGAYGVRTGRKEELTEAIPEKMGRAA